MILAARAVAEQLQIVRRYAKPRIARDLVFKVAYRAFVKRCFRPAFEAGQVMPVMHGGLIFGHAVHIDAPYKPFLRHHVQIAVYGAFSKRGQAAAQRVVYLLRAHGRFAFGYRRDDLLTLPRVLWLRHIPHLRTASL
ncbi:hypothetical protein SDC9_197318 [bioreactor metagenome]|uniref:Uncharacterized protein n=1 Tax=bioreactor metagenome TaxID=1076179 RepID=A0A645IFH4_9ZZZZ